MPLQKGKSKTVIQANIREMLRAYATTGQIGNTSPTSMKKAKAIAVAAAYHNAGKTTRARSSK
jgi:hypothetical protein